MMSLSAAPGLDLDRERAIQRVVQEIPKIDLHAHLSGCVRPSTVAELSGVRMDSIPDFRDSLQLSEPVANYSDFFRPWRSLLARVPDTPDCVHRLITEVAEDFTNDNVVYAELRVSLRRPAESGLILTYVNAISDAIMLANHKHGITLRIVLGFARHQLAHLAQPTAQALAATVLDAAASRRDLFVGFDAWGDETVSHPFDYGTWLATLGRAGFPLSLHVAEAPGDMPSQKVESILTELSPRRVSHGPALANSSELRRVLVAKNILTEVCLTSNWITRGLRQQVGGPLSRLVADGAPFALCSDNTTVLATSLTREMTYALVRGILSPTELRHSLVSAANAAFAGIETRELVLKRLIEPDVGRLFTELDGLVPAKFPAAA
jgi:adenosine deaminase